MTDSSRTVEMPAGQVLRWKAGSSRTVEVPGSVYQNHHYKHDQQSPYLMESEMDILPETLLFKVQYPVIVA